jgi:hypothetical protein
MEGKKYGEPEQEYCLPIRRYLPESSTIDAELFGLADVITCCSMVSFVMGQSWEQPLSRPVIILETGS